MNKRLIIIIAMVLLGNMNLTGSNIISGYDILNLGIGGDITTAASISLSKGVNSFYYNPALLVNGNIKKGKLHKEKNNIYAGYNRSAAGLNYMSIFSSFRINYIGKIGIGITGLLLDSFEGANYSGSGYLVENKNLSLGGYVFLFGWGSQLIDNVNIGVNVKGADNDIGGSNMGLGITGGITYKNREWGLGFTVNNLGGSIKNFKDEKYPCSIEIGGHYIFYLLKKKYSKVHKVDITDRVGYEVINNNIFNIFGVEYGYNEIIFVRSSLMYDNGKNYNIGMGIGVLYKESIKADYGITYNMLGITHRVGVGLIWGMKWIDKGDANDVKSVKIDMKNINGEKYMYLKVKDIFVKSIDKIRQSGEKMLDKVVYELNESGEKMIKILIYPGTGIRKDSEDKVDLREARAKKLYEYFVDKGINGDRIKYKVYNNIGYISDNKIKIWKEDGVTIIITRLSKEEKEKYDYYYFMGMDNKIKGMKKEALKNWEKALKIDPKNQNLKEEIKKLRKSIRKK